MGRVMSDCVAVKSSTRYGLLGITALALLSLVHSVRENATSHLTTGGDYLMGFPNVAAAVAIPSSCWASGLTRTETRHAAVRPIRARQGTWHHMQRSLAGHPDRSEKQKY